MKINFTTHERNVNENNQGTIFTYQSTVKMIKCSYPVLSQWRRKVSPFHSLVNI